MPVYCTRESVLFRGSSTAHWAKINYVPSRIPGPRPAGPTRPASPGVPPPTDDHFGVRAQPIRWQQPQQAVLGNTCDDDVERGLGPGELTAADHGRDQRQ